MRKVKVKKILALLIATSLALPSAPFAAAEETVPEVTIPDPYWEFTFDEEGDGEADDYNVLHVNNKNKDVPIKAVIDGNKDGLGIIEDEERASKVLNLPGGSTNGKKEGRLTLPDGMFDSVTNAGFAFSFWINIDGNAGQYSRVFSATIDGQNSSGSNNNKWDAPEFSFVAGKEGANDLKENGAGYNTLSVASNKNTNNALKLVWEQQFKRDYWQHVTISVSSEAYNVYLDGEKISIKYDRNNNTKSYLEKLFADNASELKKYKKCAIGASVYNTDKDLKAKMDEFRFYNTALTEEQAKKAYDNYKVDDAIIEKLKNKVAEASKNSISFYTKETYDVLAKAISDAEACIAHPVTVQQVENLVMKLEEAAAALKFYQGIDENTTFSMVQLENELKEVKTILSGGGLSEESEAKINEAITAAEAAINTQNQTAVDSALAAIRKAIDEKTNGAILNFDAEPSKSLGPLFHGSIGFLYGISEVGVPSADLLTGIKPKYLVQKPADGQQHPSDDGHRLSSFLKACDVENVQIYVQDVYLEWPYENKGLDDYNRKLEKAVRKMIFGEEGKEFTEEEVNKNIERYNFVLYNEPDGIWFGNNINTLCEWYKSSYQVVKNIDQRIKIASPSFAQYNDGYYSTFFKYCKENNCLPEYVTWHELQKDKLAKFEQHYNHFMNSVKKYYNGSGIEPIIFLNETVNRDDVGVPGILVNWLSIFDEKNIYASLPYWGLANSLNELAADTNKPNGGWWVYKWYAQMTGNKMPLKLENIEGPHAYGRLYGLTSLDEDAGIIYSLFGGGKGKQTVNIQNICSTETFKDASNAHVKIYRAKYTGHHGFADDTPVEFEGNVAFIGNDLQFTIRNAKFMDAYYAVVTPATSEENSLPEDYVKKWDKTYEAEDATLFGQAKVTEKKGGNDLAPSERKMVENIYSQNDGVRFKVNVPEDGRYRMDIYYSSQAPAVDPLTLEYVSSGGQNRAIGALSRHTLSIDGEETQEIVYDSTVKYGYYSYKTVYIELTKGTHNIRLMYSGEDQSKIGENARLCAILDRINLMYEPDQPAVLEIEPEELAGSQPGYVLAREGNYTGAGLAKGSGKFEFYVNAPRDGYYSLGTDGIGDAVLSKSRVVYAKDAKAESEVNVEWQELFNITLGEKDAVMVYLTAGINRMCLDGNNVMLDRIVFTENTAATEEKSQVIEAENCDFTNKSVNDDYNYLKGSAAVPKIVFDINASKGEVLEGFRGGLDNSVTFTVNAQEAGDYRLSVFYSNNEPAPTMKTQDGKNYVHPYNTDLVERYMQISVNGGIPQTVYFRNTLCWNTYRNTIIDLALKEGENTITFTNDNSYKFSSVQDDFTPRLDKFAIAPAVIIAPEKPSEEAVAPVITVQPEDAAYTKGNTAKALTVEASVDDGGTLSYQWYKNTVNSTEGAEEIAGEDKSSYTPSTDEAGTVYYYCKVINTKGTSSKETDSSIAGIEVTEPSVVPGEAAAPVIAAQPEDASYTKGDNAKALTVEASVSDGGTLSYQWYKNTVNSTEGAEEIAGADKNSYTPSTNEAGTVYYYCKVNNTKGTSTRATNSQTAKITITEPSGYTVTYKNNITSNADVSVSVSGKEFVSGSKVIISDRLEIKIAPGNGYTFTEAPVITASNAITSVADIKDGVYTFTIHTFKGDTDIAINGKAVKVQYKITVSPGAEKAAKDKHVTPVLDIKDISTDSTARLVLSPEKGYSIKSAVITKKEDTCTVSGWERGANGAYIIIISKFTGNTEITNINIDISETQVYESGTDTSINVGAANISETDFSNEEDVTKITGAVTNTDFINAVIDTESNQELSGNDKTEAVKEIAGAINKGAKIEMSVEVNEETDSGKVPEDEIKEALKKIKEEAEIKTGTETEEAKLAMPLDISLFAKIEGIGKKVRLNDTNTKKMVIKITVPVSIEKEKEYITSNSSDTSINKKHD